jgi:hypothetical protein
MLYMVMKITCYVAMVPTLTVFLRDYTSKSINHRKCFVGGALAKPCDIFDVSVTSDFP